MNENGRNASKIDQRNQSAHGSKLRTQSILHHHSQTGDHERHHFGYSPTDIAREMLSIILNEVANLMAIEEIREFVEKTMHSISDISLKENKPYSTEEYIFIVYIHLESTGMENFVEQLKDIRGHLLATEEVAELIVSTVERAIEIYEYEDTDSDDPAMAARNAIWSIINSRRMKRRFDVESATRITVEDILDDIIDRLSLHKLAERADEALDEEVEEEEAREEEDIQQDSEMSLDCYEFQGLFKVAEIFVDRLIQTAVEVTNAKFIERAPKPAEMSTVPQYFIKDRVREKCDQLLHNFQPQIPTIEEFTVEKGMTVISAYVSTWSYEENWAHCINYLFAQSDEWGEFYTYEVMWSMPTKIYPVAQATASVYFKIEVSRVLPPHCPVNISYQFEGNSLVRTLFKYEFEEQWLLKILDSKIALFRTVTF